MDVLLVYEKDKGRTGGIRNKKTVFWEHIYGDTVVYIE